MDRDRFDALTRALATERGSRRSFFGAVAAGLAGFVVSSPSREDAGARKRRKKTPRRDRRPGNDVTKQIIGGTSVSDGTYPFIAALLNLDNGNTTFEQQFCGGALVAANYVLTAAHCVEDFETDQRDLRVVVGRTRLNSTAGVTRSVSRVLIHPDYDPLSARHDAALLELSSPVTISPIALAEPGDDSLEVAGVRLTVIGWGDTTPQSGDAPVNSAFPDRLQEVQVPVREDQVCEDRLASFDGAIMICAGETGKDSCFGDSGGPLFGATNGVRRLSGIVSFGAGCGTSTPGAYTEVNAQPVCAFIAEELGTCGDPASDVRHCGRCCNACGPASNQCVNGQCRCGDNAPCSGGFVCDGAGGCVCPAGTVLCNGACHSTAANPCAPTVRKKRKNKKPRRKHKSGHRG